MTRAGTWRRRDFLRLGGLVGAGVGGALVLPGCGSDEGGGAKSIDIANTSSNNTMAIQKLMEQQGYLEEFGVTAKTRNLADGSKVLAAIISGGADLTITSGMGEILASIAKGAKVKLVGGSCVLSQVALYTSNPDIRTIQDLAGKSVGTGAPGAQLSQIMKALLKAKNVDSSKIRFVNIGSSADVLRAVIAGKVDAGPSTVDVYDTQKERGIRAISDIWEDIPKFIYQVMYTSDQAIEERRDALVGTLAAYAKLYDFIQSPDSEDAYVKAYTSVVSDSDAEARSLWKFAQEHKPYALDLDVDKAALRYMQKLEVDDGGLDDYLPEEKVVDRSVAKDAIALLKEKK